MTSQRQSILFALEGVTSDGADNFGNGKGYYNSGTTASPVYTAHSWIAPPPGSYFSSTPSRSTSLIRTTGTRFWDTVTYGHFSGSWEWTFILDYNYLEPLVLAFDSYTPPSSNGVHVFKKLNNTRVPSFSVRRKILNKMVGGSNDEAEDLLGCVCKSISFSKNSSNSQITVSMSGVYVNEKMLTGTLDATDYQEYSGNAAEWMCMFIGTASNDNYVANTDSMSISIGNNAYVNDNTCSPFSTSYGEGNVDFSFSTTCFSNTPERYKQRVYTGGKAPETIGASGSEYYGPLSKNLAPISLITLMTYNASARDSGTDIETAISSSTRKAEFAIDKCVIKSVPYQKGDGSKLQDQLSSVECRYLTLTVTDTDTDDTKRNQDLITDPPNAVASSADPA